MSEDAYSKPVERLFPFALRAKVVVAGRDALYRHKKKLHFLVITPELSAEGRESVLKDFEPVPVVEAFSMAAFEQHFGFRDTRVVGFLRSAIATSILRELKERGITNLRKPPPQADTASVMPAVK